MIENNELKNRIRENKYLTSNETDFIIKALEENSSLRKQVNMWQSEHAKRVLELGRLRESIKKAREEIEQTLYVDSLIFGELIDFKDGKISADDVIEEFNRVTRKEVFSILDKLIAESEG